METQEFIALAVVVALGVYFYMYWRKQQKNTLQIEPNKQQNKTKSKYKNKNKKQYKKETKQNKIIKATKKKSSDFKSKSNPKKQHQIKEEKEEKSKDDLVYLDIGSNDKKLGKIVIKLHSDIVPKTCLNFRTLCEKKSYRKAPFHRIIKDFMIQGGDFASGDGRGGMSIWGEKFDDENFELKNEPYMISMANSGPNTNGSQFFILTSHSPHLDGKHVVFGEVVDGFDLVDHLNEVQTGREDRPNDHIHIADCGVI